jgi:hypothetical protein
MIVLVYGGNGWIGSQTITPFNISKADFYGIKN